jgi:hypothetical protein
MSDAIPLVSEVLANVIPLSSDADEPGKTCFWTTVARIRYHADAMPGSVRNLIKNQESIFATKTVFASRSSL